MRAWSRGKLTIFQSTLSVRRATWRPLTMEQSEAISIHALRKESDFGFRGSVAGKHISIHALRKESDRVQLRLGQVGAISIHALRKESDPSAEPTFDTNLISIHALRKESDPFLRGFDLRDIFQSTLSVRRATSAPNGLTGGWTFQSTLSVRRATRATDSELATILFQSTLSVRRATAEYIRLDSSKLISIHALRKESDQSQPPPLTSELFQSTLSVRRATVQLDIFVHFLRRKPAAWL